MKRFILPIYLTVLIIAITLLYRVFIKNNDLTIFGTINYADGIGRQPLDLINMLDGSNLDINFLGNIVSNRDIGANAKSVLRNYNFKIGKIFINEENLGVNSSDHNILDALIYRLAKKINPIDRKKQIWIAYSMVESDKINKSWTEELNSNYDAVVLPDPNLINIYENSGVTIPIFVVPLSVDYNYHLNKPIKKAAHPIFTFGNLASFEDRKNTLKLVQAFDKAFKNNDKVRLLLSPRKGDPSYRQKIVDYIIENNLTNVDYNLFSKDAATYNSYFDQIDCYVSLAKGEGFSVQPREAMARGIPVIVSNSLAQKTIAASGLVKSVPANYPKIATYYDNNLLLGKNYDVSLEDAANAMLDVYNNYKKYLANSDKLREWATKYDYEHIKPFYINLVKPKNIILGDKNEITDNYLMTNSEALYKKYKNLYK